MLEKKEKKKVRKKNGMTLEIIPLKKTLHAYIILNSNLIFNNNYNQIG